MEFLGLHALQLFAPVEVAGQKRWAAVDTCATTDFAYGLFDGVEAEGEDAPISGAVGEARRPASGPPSVPWWT